MKLQLLWIILASMFIPPPERWIGFFVAGCVLALFFFPLAHGSFQATHGPTTVFRAKRLLSTVLYAICATLLAFARTRLRLHLSQPNVARAFLDFADSSSPWSLPAILRC